MTSPAALRIRIEARSRDYPLVFGAALLLVGIRVAATVRVSAADGLFAATHSAALALLQFAPLCLCLPGALAAARDHEARLGEQLAPAQVPRHWLLRQQAVVAVSLAGAVAVTASFLAAAAGLVVRGTGFEPEGWSVAVATLLCLVPVWAAWGLVAARLARTRPLVPLLVLAFWLVLLVIERLAVAVPVVRWLHLVSPIGLADFLMSGTHLTSLPGHIPGAVALLVPIVALGVPLVLVPLVRGRDRARTSARRVRTRTTSSAWRRSGAPAAAAFVAACLLFGFAAPSAVATVIPWRLSPTWLIDEAVGTLPDAPVRRFFLALQEGDTRTADEMTLVGDHVRTLGVLRAALERPPRDLRIAIDRNAPVAGTLRVRWTGPHEQHEVLACTVRQPRGWKLAVFSSGPTCPSSL